MPEGTACVEVVPWGTCARDIALPQTARRRSATAREPEALRSSRGHLSRPSRDPGCERRTDQPADLRSGVFPQPHGHPNALAPIVQRFFPINAARLDDILPFCYWRHGFV